MSYPEYDYLTGFGNQFEPKLCSVLRRQFSSQKINHNLYAEQYNTTAFTAPRAENRRNWFYRIRLLLFRVTINH